MGLFGKKKDFWDEVDEVSMDESEETILDEDEQEHGSGAMTRSPSPLAWRPDFPGAPREAH